MCRSALGLLFGAGGCLSRVTAGDGRLRIVTSHPDAQLLTVSIAPEYGAESVFSETFVVDEDTAPIERDAVVTGRTGDDFFVEVQQESTGETYETIWELTCTGTDDRDDRLILAVTEGGGVRFSQHRCADGFEDPPADED